MNGAPITLSINGIFQSRFNKNRKWVRGALNYPNGNKRLIVQRQYQFDHTNDIKTDKLERTSTLELRS